VHLHNFDASFSNTSTPDWLLHLAAQHAGMEGVVSTDPSQLEQDEEAVALTATRLSLVTWTRRIDDPVQLWGSLIAFMPEVLRRIDRNGPCLVTLPVPRINSDRIEPTAGIGGRIASGRGTSPSELRAAVLPDMKEELADRGLHHLAAYLDRPRPGRRGSKP